LSKTHSRLKNKRPPSGALEIIEDGVTDRLFPIGDPESLPDAIPELLVDRPDRECPGANALQAVNQRFSLERVVDTTERLLDEVIERIRANHVLASISR
jgi:glycosyltransferase involved in cell wall biosynthesis